jgi:hypothetical protein
MAEITPAAPSEQDQIEIYQLYIGLREVSPATWRRLLVRSDSTIFDLHYTLQLAFGWSDSHLNRFLIHGRQYGVAKIGGCIFWDDPTEIKLSELKLRIKQRFVYEYDFYDQWLHEIRLENKLSLSSKKAYPICIAGSGRTPPEECGGALAHLKQLEEHSLVSIQMRMNDIWDEVARTILSEDGDIRSVYEGNQEEVAFLQRSLDRHSNIFDRTTVNQRLKKFGLKDKEWWRGLDTERR